MSLPSNLQTDESLIPLVASGDATAFEDLIRRYQSSLHGFAARYVFDRDDVCDLVQETFLCVPEAAKRFDGERPVAPWLRGICRHLIMNHLRKRAACARGTQLLAYNVTLDEMAQSELAMETESGEQGRAAALAACLDTLHEKHKEILLWRYRLNLPVHEIARRLVKTPNSVSMILLRLKDGLGKCIDARLSLPLGRR